MDWVCLDRCVVLADQRSQRIDELVQSILEPINYRHITISKPFRALVESYGACKPNMKRHGRKPLRYRLLILEAEDISDEVV